jgi:hypothetical protein
MPVINTDAVLWYNVGLFGEIGYGFPNPSNKVGTLNHSIGDLVTLLGRNLFSIMHHEDVDLRVPPSVNTLRRVHKLYLRSVQILAGRAIPPGELNMEAQHVSPGGEMFRVFPCPYFRVRNHFLKRWAALVMMALSEAMQHTENRKAIEISTGFAGQIGQYLTRVYTNMAIELFGKTREQALAPGFVLADEDFAAYDPSKFFTQTEMVDTVPHLGQVLTEDRLAVLAEGIVVTDLPALQPWPTNLTNWYEREMAAASNAVDRQLGEGGAGGETATGGGATAAGMALPPPPGP